MQYKHIFWDWNGTLLDDAYAAYLAVNAMLKSRQLPLITFEQYREYIDVPIIRFYEQVMDMSKENMEALSVEFNTLWAEFLPLNPLFSGVKELLKVLCRKGIQQYIFSSSHNDIIMPNLEKYGISDYFTAVLGASDCYVGSKAERTRNFIVSQGISPDESLFIGDMAHDNEVAEYIGADCILISQGHQCESALLATGRKVLSSVEQISDILNRL